MPGKICVGVIAALSLLMSAAPVRAQDDSASQAVAAKQAKVSKPRNYREEIAQLEKKSQEALEAEKWVRYYSANMKLNQILPYETDYLVNVIEACAMIDRKTSAYHYMLELQQQGFSHDFNSTDRTLQIRETEAYEYINNLLIDAGKPAGVAMPVFTIGGDPQNFRSMAWDPTREKFLVGTLAEGKVIAVSDNGKSKQLLKADSENGLWSITGIEVDAERNRLWIVSAPTPSFQSYNPSNKNHGALFEFDLKSLAKLGQYDMPADLLNHELGSSAMADDGTIYLIDHATPIIYRKAPAGDQLEVFFASPQMLGLTDIAVAPDNSRIFVSDSKQGVLVIDPVGQEAALLSGPKTMNVGGVDGVEFLAGRLFLIQGGFTPQRIVRLELDQVSGATVESVSPMVIANEAFDRPTRGTIRGNDLFYFSNSAAVDAKELVVMSTPVDAGVQVAPPDLTEFENALRAKTQ